MGFSSVFRSLQEIFPEVDVRILKAVAIEHSNDVDAAAEAILFEILPTLCGPEEAINPDQQEAKHPSVRVDSGEQSFALNHQEEVEEVPKGPFFPEEVSTCEDFDGTDHQIDSSCHHSTSLDDACFAASVLTASDHDANTGLLPSLMVVVDQGSHAAPISRANEDLVVANGSSSSLHDCIQDLRVKQDCFGGNCEGLLDINSSKDGTTIQNFHSYPLILEENGSIRHMDAGGRDDNLLISECTGTASTVPLKPHLTATANPDDGPETVDGHNEPHLTKAAQSSQIISIDYLEGFVTDAKSNKVHPRVQTIDQGDPIVLADDLDHIKKTLLLAMESILNLVREVEVQEKAAEKAKEEAAKGGLDILAKVEDLRQMLEHAKETNAMHSGEVYGERAILATEARELQSRLLNLSDERDRSLLIIDEMRQDLESRLAAAAEERTAAEQEKQRKEESASKAFAEQEFIMERVVHESKKLQQEAEENAKLRDFLMDRGRVVDVLQGEIAVVCEDVKKLKERIDGRLPVSKSLSSSQASYISAASITSQKNASPDRVHELANSSGSSGTMSEELSHSMPSDVAEPESSWMESGVETSLKESSGNDNGAGGGKKVPSDDEWYLCDD